MPDPLLSPKHAPKSPQTQTADNLDELLSHETEAESSDIAAALHSPQPQHLTPAIMRSMQQMYGNRFTSQYVQRALATIQRAVKKGTVADGVKQLGDWIVKNMGSLAFTQVKIGKANKKTYAKESDTYVGGDVYMNKSGDLPTATSYTEWDTNPYTKGVGRGTDRIVIGADGKKYFTGDHYANFTEFD